MGGPVIFRRVLGTGFFGPKNGFFNGLEDGTFFRLGFKEGPGAGGNFLTTFVVGEGRFLALKVVFVVIVVLGFVVVVVVEVEVVVETVVETVGLTNAAADGTGGGGG